MDKKKVEIKKGFCGYCYYFSQWQEYGVWFADCNFIWPDDEDLNDIGYKTTCPNWKLITVYNCPKHGEFTDGCEGCEEDYYQEIHKPVVKGESDG